MQITCKICGFISKSLIIQPEMAFQAISKTFTSHLQKSHKPQMDETAKQIQLSMMALAQFMTIGMLANVNDSETFILDQMVKSQDIVMAGLGFKADREKGEATVIESDEVDTNTGVMEKEMEKEIEKERGDWGIVG